MDNPNLHLWNTAEPTEERHTKGFKKGGGFGGTSVNATYLFKRATEVFGPVGLGWGFKVIDERYVPGAQGVVRDIEIVDIIHVIRIEFWWRHQDDHEAIGRFESYGQTQMVGINKNGGYTDEEAPKKSLTDAITKALSMLGFASEIHMGLWDDNKYVRAADREGAAEKEAEQAELRKRLIEAAGKEVEEIVTSTSIPRFDFLITKAKAHFERLKLVDGEAYLKLRAVITNHRATLTEEQPDV